MMPQAQKEHRWLEKLAGQWSFETEWEEPGKPRQKITGTETVRSIGGLWTIAEGTGEMPGGGTGLTVMTLGFDPQKGHFVGTFIGSMMTNLWVYKGTLSNNVLTLEATGPDMESAEQTRPYRDVIEIKSDYERLFTSYVEGDDGEWQLLAESVYRRTG
jgi:hypothetical protein